MIQSMGRARFFGVYLGCFAALFHCGGRLDDIVPPADAGGTVGGDGGLSASALDGASGTPDGGGPMDAPPPETGVVVEKQPTCGAASSMTLCDGVCTDLETDPANCGACGHDCLGGACSLGRCQPFVLASLPAKTTPGQVATDGAYVVWTAVGPRTAHGGVYSVLSNGGPNQKPFLVDQVVAGAAKDDTAYLGPVVMAGGMAFWTVTAGGAAWLELGIPNQYPGGGIFPIVGVTSTAVAASGDLVVWGGYDPTDRTVHIASVDAASLVQTNYATQVDSNGMAGIATDGKNAYYTQPTALKQTPLAPSSTPAPFLTGLGEPQQIVAAGSYLYFADHANGSFVRSTVPNAAPSMVLDGGKRMQCAGLAADSKYLYWTDGRAVVSYTRADGSGVPMVLAQGKGPTAIAIDGQGLYFIDPPAGTVNKVALPL
jgi:hypothetical protein